MAEKNENTDENSAHGGWWGLPFDQTTNFSLLGFFFELFGISEGSGDRKKTDLSLNG